MTRVQSKLGQAFAESPKAKRPWFNFIELTTLDNFASSEAEPLSAATTAERFAADYQKSAQAADAQLATIYAELERLDLIDNTVVITSPIMVLEFNETKTNSRGANLTTVVLSIAGSAVYHQLAR